MIQSQKDALSRKKALYHDITVVLEEVHHAYQADRLYELFEKKFTALLEEKAAQVREMREKLADTGGMTGHYIAGQKKALQDIERILQGE